MALLWRQVVAQQQQHEAMAWYDDGSVPRQQSKPISVRKAGFKGYVGGGYDTEDYRNPDDPPEHEFDESLYEDVTPHPKAHEQKHYDKHGEYPDSYYDRHDKAYSKAVADKAKENEPDHLDEPLHTFISSESNEPSLWRSKGRLGQVDISKGVYATQSHVNQFHVDRYLRDRGAKSWNDTKGAPTGGEDPHRYLGHDHPMFVTHEGRLHAIEGHHRVAADLQSGQSHTYGWHYDADKHGLPEDEDDY